MELLFVYPHKSGVGLAHKIVKLPDTVFGMLAYELDEGRYLEIAGVWRGEIVVTGEVHDDKDALHNSLWEFREDYPRQQQEAKLRIARREFEEKLASFAAANPSALELVAFARTLADASAFYLDDLIEPPEAAGEQQLELLKAAE